MLVYISIIVSIKSHHLVFLKNELGLVIRYKYIRAFNMLIWRTIDPKSFLFGTIHTVLTLGQMAQLIMIILSLTAMTHCKLAQDVFLMAHTLTIVKPIWPMLQNISESLNYIIIM